MKNNVSRKLPLEAPPLVGGEDVTRTTIILRAEDPHEPSIMS